MSTNKHIQDELRELNSTLPSDAKKPVFSVPENYFENFAASVLLKIKEEAAVSAADELTSLSPLLAGLSKKMPFEVPENYFSTLDSEVPSLIQEDPFPSFLAEDNRTNPYETPAGYFDTLPQQVLTKVTKQPAKVVALDRTRWMRVAAAAMVAGVIAISGLLYYNNRTTTETAASPESWIASELKNVSNQDLEDFIETTAMPADKQMASASKVEVRKMLDDVSVKELDAFLAQVPTDDEELLIIN